MQKYIQHHKKIVYSFIDGFIKHDLMTYAAALSFYTVLSLAPLVLFMITAAKFINSGFELNHMIQVHKLMGVDASEAIEAIIQSVHHKQDFKSFTGVLGLIVIIFSASRVFSLHFYLLLVKS